MLPLPSLSVSLQRSGGMIIANLTTQKKHKAADDDDQSIVRTINTISLSLSIR